MTVFENVVCYQAEVNATGRSLNQRSPMDDYDSVVCCQIEVSVTGRSLIQRSPMNVSCECCVLSGRGLCDVPIPHPEESYE